MGFWTKMFGQQKSDSNSSPIQSHDPQPARPSDFPGKGADANGSAGKAIPSGDSSEAEAESASAQQPVSPENRIIRVFVSSTFRDMIEDRDELMTQAWPKLRSLCRERSVEFVEVDLRWGITEEQAQRKETVRQCLAEIKRCRPYFIGLLGERYGWVPGPEAYSSDLLEEEGWLEREIAKKSATELEILYGVLNNPEMAGRAFFYFRDPAYAQTRGGDYLPEDATSAASQQALKQQIASVCRQKHIPLRENGLYRDPRQLPALVVNDLTAVIEAEFPAGQVPDVWAREDRDHEAYARSRRTAFYIGRDAYYEQLGAFAREGAEGRGFVVLGESGGGKSTLLAHWVEHWRKAHPDDFVFQHYIGSSPMSAGHFALMRRLMVAIIRWCREGFDAAAALGSEEEKIPAKPEEIVRRFPEYLGRLAFRAKEKGVRTILVLDALNQLEDVEKGRLLAWLPNYLPGPVRLIVSSLPGDTLDALKLRGWPTLRVEPLTSIERVQLITRYLAHFSRGLSETRAEKIAAVTAAANPLYLKTLLDDLRATGAHERLDEQITDYLTAADIPALFGKIITRYEQAYERDRPGLVREALSLLWAARRGLTEPELLEALKPEGQVRLPTALWSPLRCALEDGLLDRDGVLAFAHEHLRVAVERCYANDGVTAKVLRLHLADTFASRPTDARQADELPWLLRQAESRDRLRACLLDIHRFLLIRERNQDELLGYWVWLQEERMMGKGYLTSFEAWAGKPGHPGLHIAGTANQMASFLEYASLYAEAEPLYRHSLTILEQKLGSNHPRVGMALNNLARLLQATNRLAEAETLFRRALAIQEQNLGPNHLDVGTVLNNLAQLLQFANRLNETEPLMRRALAIWEQYLGPNHPDVGIALDNLAGLLQDMKRLKKAEPLYRRALAILEQNRGPNDPDVGIALNNLAQLLQDMKKLKEAEPLMLRALAIWEQSFGTNHPNVGIALNNLAHLLQATNRLADAELLRRRVLEIYVLFTNVTGHPHPNMTGAISDYCRLLRVMGHSDAEIRTIMHNRVPKLFEDN